ncbi:PepSY domain-containing protein [Methylocapsa sp. S129]|uniref:PepSY domain-containing protein n=1 Tax=Methylocapsa sp. S129 TaxID=1641869 RepID=UPI00131D2B77|nr:PepSY domain-containing protein [Methylocapsa sp. S129]
MARKSIPPIVLALGALICAPAIAPVRAQAPPAVKAVCLATSETREEIKSHHLLEPFVVLKSAAVAISSPKNKAEALSAKLCRLGDEYVYEIALLHHDGRLVHVVMSAVTGKVVNTRISREAPPRT